MKKGHIGDPTEWIKGCIVDFARTPENTLKNKENDPAWDDPLVGFASGDDPLWEELKKDIGPFYWTPSEVFAKTFPDLQAAPGDLTVISWILAHTARTKADNRREKTYPSESWARSRIYGEEFNVKLRQQLVAVLAARGFEAMAPLLSPFWEQTLSEKYSFASTWSERHAAYVAGLGTFGLCDGLITPLGKAIRVGSVVAQIRIPASERPYENHHAYCTFFASGECGKCIDRCPVGAITKEGHNKEICRQYVGEDMRKYATEKFGFASYGCGLCQTAVPCESGIPHIHPPSAV
jgi:epoxyqueuosine reductase